LAKEPINPFTIEWHPFQLNPEMPLAGMNRQDYLEQKFGGKQNAYRVYSRISSTAVKAGLNLELQLIKKTPNTLNAHRLIHWAGIEGLQNSVVSALFESYFVKGEDIGDLSTLVKIGASVGLDKDLISKLLKEDTELIEIKQRDANSRERGVTGVPTFIIANTHVLPGAQTEELWSSILLDIKQLKQDKNAE